jgi:hypothetical protein
MAGVDLTVSESLDGAQIADALSGGGTGTSLGQVTNGSYSPVVSAPANSGRQDHFIRHNAVVDQVTDFKVFFQTYGVGTGFTYGGPGTRSAAADFASIRAEGDASGSSKNNGDGLSSGLWIEMNVAEMITGTNQFDIGTRPAEVKIFGDAGQTVMIDLASAEVVQSTAMVIDSDQGSGGNGTDGWIPTGPVDGEIGVNNDTALGDNAHIAMRIYLRSAFSTGGIHQIEIVYVYTFTA